MSRLDELRAWKEEQAKAAADRLAALEEAELELEFKYTSELGPRGIAFEVVRTSLGCFAVRKPELIVARQFESKDERTVEDAVQFVMPCVLGDDGKKLARSLATEHAGAMWLAAALLMSLYQGQVATRKGK